MPRDINTGFGGLFSLTTTTSFLRQYVATCQEIGARTNLHPNCKTADIPDVCEAFREEYFVLMSQHRSRRVFLTAACAKLVQICARGNLIDYTSIQAPSGGVLILEEARIAKVVRERPNVTTALSFAAVIYSIEQKKRTGREPSCQLNLDLIARAAKGFNGQRFTSRDFLKFLGLQPATR